MSELTHRRMPRDMIDRVLRERGVSRNDIAAAIVAQDADHVVVDINNSAWPRGHKRSDPPSSSESLPRDIAERWAMGERRTQLANPRIDAESQWWRDLIRDRSKQSRDIVDQYLKEHPPAVQSPEWYWRWYVDLRNHINKNIGKPTLTYDAAREKSPLFRATQNGDVIIPSRIVCLSLDSRPDRWQALTESAKRSKYLSQWPIERYRARPPAELLIPDWWPAELGPTHFATRADHLVIIERSYAAGDDTLLILEDDAIIQDGFDDAYKAACSALPAQWLGLWLSSDGHKKPPVPIAPGLVRCTDQTMLHAYMLNRRGMHRVWHHIQTNRSQIIDGATEDLHGIEPHFYATSTNAVRQFGCRYEGVRSNFHDSI